MKNKIEVICLLSLFSLLIFQVQPGFSGSLNPDTDNAGSSNKIAVAADGDSINSEISMNAGRAAFYLIYDENGIFQKSIKNPAQNRRGGASTEVINLLLKESCKTFIAGNFGEKMHAQLLENDIKYFRHEGIVKNIIQDFVNK